MNSTPFFSIIIPTFNRANLIHIPIKSVIEQSYNDWELIIVDDGSTDHTKQVVQAFKDDRIQYFYKKNEERSIARNFGIDKANGKYLCFLDSDDYYEDTHLQEHFIAIEKKNFPIAGFFSGSFVESQGIKKKDIHLFENNQPVRDLWKYGFNLLPFSFHRSIFESIRLNPDLVFMEDVYLLLDIFSSYKVYPLFTHTNVIVVHPERSTDLCYTTSVRQNGDTHLAAIETIINIHQEYLQQYLTKQEIFSKKKNVILTFLKACIKRGNMPCMIHFFWKYLFSNVKK